MTEREEYPQHPVYDKNSIETIYGYKENLEDNIQYIKENNKTTLAQVFTDVRYTTANNIHFSTEFMNVLKRQGFID